MGQRDELGVRVNYTNNGLGGVQAVGQGVSEMQWAEGLQVWGVGVHVVGNRGRAWNGYMHSLGRATRAIGCVACMQWGRVQMRMEHKGAAMGDDILECGAHV